uniref:Calx-beta domain-containing protein n=1 Tax=Candidatus Kentrum sp. LFY TaxID=2126342 RepID=A0A450UT70_9GAMM|nr:MAG: Calx-beta domain-containing protein [Candidatus Kentron sp. LFY]
MSDIGSNIHTREELHLDNYRTSRIDHRYDQDWFRIYLRAGQRVRFDLEGSPTGRGTLSDTYLRGIYNGSGSRLGGTTNDDGGTSTNSRVTFTASSSGNYYVAAGAYSSRTGSYRLTATSLGRSPTGRPDLIISSGNATGSFTSGGRVTANVTLGNQGASTSSTFYTRYYLSTNSSITTSDTYLDYDTTYGLSGGSSTGESESFNLPTNLTSGRTYYIGAIVDYDGRVSESNESNNARVLRSFTVPSLTDDFSQNTRTQGRLSLGSNATGNIERSGDQDWFRIRLNQGQQVRFDLEGSPTGRGTLRDTYLRGIYDSSGSQLSGTTNDDGGTSTNSRVTFTASRTGDYYVSAGAYSGTGTYRLTATALGSTQPPSPPPSSTDDFSANTGTRGRLSLGGNTTGNIERSGDQDWFRIRLNQGQRVRFDLEGRPTGRGTLSDTYLRGIYDSSGNQIGGTTNDDGGTGTNSRVDFTANRTGDYYVAAGAYSSRTGTYRLAVSSIGTTTPSQPTILSIAATGADKNEGNNGNTPFTFTVTRSGNTSGSSSAYWTVSGHGSNAASGSDFTSGSFPGSRVTFAPGETRKTVTVYVSGDTSVELNENFRVQLSNSSGAAIGTSTAYGTIRNEDSFFDYLSRAAAYVATGARSALDWTMDNIRSALTTKYNNGTKYLAYVTSPTVDIPHPYTFGLTSTSIGATAYFDIADIMGITQEGRGGYAGNENGWVTTWIDAEASLLSLGAGYSPVGIVEIEDIDVFETDPTRQFDLSLGSVEFRGLTFSTD